MKTRREPPKLAQELFQSQAAFARLRTMIVEKIEERLGLGLGPLEFYAPDDAIEFLGTMPEFRLSPVTQALLWELGFLRAHLFHQDGRKTYYYVGGDPAGYRS